MNKKIIFASVFFLVLSQHSMAGVIIVDDSDITKNEKTDGQQNDKEASNTPDEYKSKYREIKDDKSSQKKNLKTPLILSF